MVRNPGRLLAPIAIAAVAVVLYLIVDGNLGSSRGPKVRPVATQVRRTHHRAAVTRAAPKFYTVRAGDTLSAIASATRVPLSQLEQLNPSLGPTDALHTGQRLRLRR